LDQFQTEGINGLQNDFERSVFQAFPLIQELKNALYNAGATYAAMSGSGSSVFGIFEEEPILTADVSRQCIYNGPWHF
jgi:4-diphosphocytidyl-2-C-methyl-D-erythritol kinase